MFFKRVELFGFKSFAHKTQVDFEYGVTAIVGPNGCGKSNLTDAIKWVLGEQSVRSMRGTKMEDVIFHGTDDIPPVGFSEVSLTISNQNNILPLDYEEVTLTRRLYRSGESEYLINKVPVRLKDIFELLMGTGLGIHSYSIMAQGEVDQILSSKPEERREIFEEASDITKYKSKKEEALRKLERTNENIQRLGDIIVEVKRQIKSIERQVTKARRYKEEFERLKGYELQVARYQFRKLSKEKKDLESKVSGFKTQEASLLTQRESSAQAIENKRADLSVLEEGISRIQAESYDLASAAKTAQTKTSLNEERIEELTRRSQEIKQQLEQLERKIAGAAEQREQVKQQIEAIEQKKQEKHLLLEESQRRIEEIAEEIKEAEKRLTQDKTEQVELITQEARQKNEIAKLEANLANYQARLRRLNVEKERTEEELNDAQKRHNATLEYLQTMQDQAKRIAREIWDLKSNLDVKLQKRQKLNFRLEEVSRQTTQLASKLHFLKEMTARYEGFSSGVRALLSAIDEQSLNIQGLADVVANLVEVPAQYQLAVETALGDNAQAIIAENAQAAEEAINFLKTKDAGRAKFILLDGFSCLNVRNDKPADCLGRISEFVKVDPRYQKAIETILADIFVAPDLETARQILAGIPADTSIKLVTLNGAMLSKGSIIAGSTPQNLDCSLLGRKEKIAEAQKQWQDLQQEKIETEGVKAEIDQEITDIENEANEKDADLTKHKINLTNKEHEKASIETEIKRFEDELAVLSSEREETREQAQRLQQEKEDWEQEFNRLQEKEKQLQDDIRRDQESITQKNQERHDSLVQIAEAKAQLQALDKQAEQAQQRLEMIAEGESEQRQLQDSRQAEDRDISAKIAQLKQEIEQLKAQSNNLSQAKIDVEEKLAQAMQERQQLNAKLRESEQHLKAIQNELNTLHEQKANLQVTLTEVDYKQSSLADKMKNTYQVDLVTHLDEATEIQAVEDAVYAEIAQLQSRLQGLGPVNLVAIDEDEQLKQRFTFLTNQQEDLIKAQDSLRKAIVQINQTARKMFIETFEKIQGTFKEYFRILFGGGDARLILVDENNLLESGIEIVVRPPGKRLQNISLLSGGEKALTAIALHFAIFKVKPSPFCILDEVDAALDEANVDRFTRLLGEFVKTSQFIIVTHNKKTINMADIMYGITMERSGVSKLVSVRLTQDDQQSSEREVASVEG